MKITIIKASAPGPYKKYKQQRGGPPQNIFSLAAATPPDIRIELIDETGGMKVDRKTDSELVVIMMSTPDAYHAYELADHFRSQEKTVVIGGLHATFMSEEALEHGDAVLKGESENVWHKLLTDYKTGGLKKIYQSKTAVDLELVKPYPNDLITPQVYNGFWSVLVSRGCPLNCSFCLVNRFFDGQRYRPVGAVIDEIRRSGAQWLELHADNLTFDREYAKELFTALEPLNVKWAGETTIKLAEDDELLSLAAKSGLIYLLVGLETPSKSALHDVSKGFVSPERARDYVAKLHEYNIIVDSSMLFGMDVHDKDIFAESLEFVQYVGIDVCEGILMIPFPGTKLFAKLEVENRIITRDWSKYDGSHAVFEPAKMSVAELEEGFNRFWLGYNSPQAILKRKMRQVKNIGLVNTSYISFL